MSSTRISPKQIQLLQEFLNETNFTPVKNVPRELFQNLCDRLNICNPGTRKSYNDWIITYNKQKWNNKINVDLVSDEREGPYFITKAKTLPHQTYKMKTSTPKKGNSPSFPNEPNKATSVSKPIMSPKKPKRRVLKVQIMLLKRFHEEMMKKEKAGKLDPNVKFTLWKKFCKHMNSCHGPRKNLLEWKKFYSTWKIKEKKAGRAKRQRLQSGEENASADLTGNTKNIANTSRHESRFNASGYQYVPAVHQLSKVAKTSDAENKTTDEIGAIEYRMIKIESFIKTLREDVDALKQHDEIMQAIYI